MNKKPTIIIKDISEGKEKGYAALIPELNNSLILGEDLVELSEGIALTLELAKKKGITKMTKKKDRKIIIKKTVKTDSTLAKF